MFEFSVVMAVYYGDDDYKFKKAIESIYFAQTYRPTEILLIVDGPVGNAINKVILEMEKAISCLQVIRLKDNKGLGEALKTGVELANCEWIARMDSDDISYPKRFERQIEFLKHNSNIDVLGSYIIEESGGVYYQKNVPLIDEEIKQGMKWKNTMNHVTIMARKSQILKSGNYRSVYYAEDYDLWVRMMHNNAKFSNMDEELVEVSAGDSMLSRRGKLELIESWDIITKELYTNGHITFFLLIMRKVYIRIWVRMPRNIKKIVYKYILRKKSMRNPLTPSIKNEESGGINGKH